MTNIERFMDFIIDKLGAKNVIAALSKQPKRYSCPNCKAILKDTFFCSNCGTPLRGIYND